MDKSLKLICDQATALYRKGQVGQALALVDDALKSNAVAELLVLKAQLLLAENRFEDAFAASADALAAAPDMAEAFSARGDILSAMRRDDEAINNYDRAIALDPHFADAFYNRGAALQGLGRHEEAVLSFDQAVFLRPSFFQASYNRGITLMALGRSAQAIESFEQSLAANPRQAEAWFHRGNILIAQGRLPEAVESYNRALALAPNAANIWNDRGNALQHLKQFQAALASYDRAIAIAPDLAEAHNNRGNAMLAVKKFDMALASFEQAISLKPDYAYAHSNRANALRELKQPEAAVASASKAILLDPDFAEAYSNRGTALLECNRLDEAIVDFNAAISFKPHLAEAYCNRSAALQYSGRLDEAAVSVEKAISLKSDYAGAYLIKSHLLLLSGNFEEGWPLYEWRHSVRHGVKRDFCQPLWLGHEDLAGKTILLHGEQGLGDTIQFCRYAKPAAALGARVILEVQKPLIGLLTQLDGVSEIVEKGAPLPDFDYHCPLLSLPLAFKTNLRNIPAAPYLKCEADRARLWQDRLGEKKKKRMGLAWSGSTENGRDHSRSMALSQLLPHLSGDYDYFSVQKDLRDTDLAALRDGGIRHFGDALTDFRDNAALCDLMDVIISVDTSVAHLAGALGKRTCLMLSHNADWRWLLDRTDSPWYSSMQLYRQSAAGDWDGVISRVMADLRQYSPS